MFANRPVFLGSLPPVVRNLLIINVLLWLASFTFGNSINVTYYFGLHYWQSEMFNPAQFISYMFLHQNAFFPWHLFFNMFALYMFGRVLEQVMGSKRFLFYYITCGIGAALAQQIVWSFSIMPAVAEVHREVANGAPAAYLVQMQAELNRFITIGASGSVFGLLLGFGYLFPNQQIMLLFPPIPLKAKYFVLIYAIIELFFGVARFEGDSIAHFAHLGGLLVGMLVLWYWRRNPSNHFKQ